MKLWTVAPLDKSQAVSIQTEYGLPAITAMLLQIRSIKDREEIEDFLTNDSQIADPFEIKDMDKAVERIRRAIDNCESICVYGDYDADGVTSTALLYSYLDTVGANAMYYIPSRETEGYGMNMNAVELLHERGVRLIVTVDNGVSAIKEIEYANSLGIDTVVTDHHQPLEQLPNAVAVVDLHRKDCPSKFKYLSGVGVAFKLIMALEGEYCDVDTLLDNYADLLCMGTVGDIVKLRGENRVFVKRGLDCIMNTDRVGLQALLRNVGLENKKISAGNVAFTLVPRINAVGRLGMSQKSVELLVTDDDELAEETAQELCSDNSERQDIEKQIIEKIDAKLRSNPSMLLDRVLVLDGEDWHQGVIGIVASRIREAFGKPVIILSVNGDETKGSGRSVEGFSICDAIFTCADLLTHYGGHPMACGLSMNTSNIELFRKRINEYAQNVTMPFDKLNIDCKLNPAYVNTQLVEDCMCMQPYGAGNPTPVFGLFRMKLEDIIPLSNNKHLRLVFSRDGSRVTAMKFFCSTDEFPYIKGDVLDLAVNLDLNEYNGTTSVTIKISDIKPSDAIPEQILESGRLYEYFKLGTELSQAQKAELIPDRNDFALMYRFLKSFGDYNYPLETLVHRLDNKLSFGKIRVITEAMAELGLIEYSEGIGSSRLALLPVNGRVSLDSASIIRRLRGV